MGTEYGASVDDIRNALALEVLLGEEALEGGALADETRGEDWNESESDEAQDVDQKEWEDDDDWRSASVVEEAEIGGEHDYDYDDQGPDDGAYFLRCALAAASHGDDTYLVDFLVLGIPVPFSFRRHIFTVNNRSDDGRGRILPRAVSSSIPAHDSNLGTTLFSTTPVPFALVDDDNRIPVVTTVTFPNIPPPVDFNSNPPSGELRKFFSVLLGDQILASSGLVPSSTNPLLLKPSLSLQVTPSTALSFSDVGTQLSAPMNLLSFSQDEYEFILNPFQGEISGQGSERSCDVGDWGREEYCLSHGVLEEIGQVDDVGSEHVRIGEEIVYSGDGPVGCSESGGVVDGSLECDCAQSSVSSRREEDGQFRMFGCPDPGGAFCDSEGDFQVCWDPGGD